MCCGPDIFVCVFVVCLLRVREIDWYEREGDVKEKKVRIKGVKRVYRCVLCCVCVLCGKRRSSGRSFYLCSERRRGNKPHEPAT